MREIYRQRKSRISLSIYIYIYHCIITSELLQFCKRERGYCTMSYNELHKFALELFRGKLESSLSLSLCMWWAWYNICIYIYEFVRRETRLEMLRVARCVCLNMLIKGLTEYIHIIKLYNSYVMSISLTILFPFCSWQKALSLSLSRV